MPPNFIRGLMVAVLFTIVAACKPKQETSDLELNGWIESGWIVGNDHWWMGRTASEVFARANTQIELKFLEMPGDHEGRCYLVPILTGYEVVLLTRTRLSEQDRKWAEKIVEDALAQAETEANAFERLRDEEARQTPRPQ